MSESVRELIEKARLAAGEEVGHDTGDGLLYLALATALESTDSKRVAVVSAVKVLAESILFPEDAEAGRAAILAMLSGEETANTREAAQVATGTEWGIEWSDSRPDYREVLAGFGSEGAASTHLYHCGLFGNVVSRKCTYGAWQAAE